MEKVDITNLMTREIQKLRYEHPDGSVKTIKDKIYWCWDDNVEGGEEKC